MAIGVGVKGSIEKMNDNREALMRDRKEKNEFLFGSNNLNRYDGHSHLVIGDNSKVHYIRERMIQRRLQTGKMQKAITEVF